MFPLMLLLMMFPLMLLLMMFPLMLLLMFFLLVLKLRILPRKHLWALRTRPDLCSGWSSLHDMKIFHMFIQRILAGKFVITFVALQRLFPFPPVHSILMIPDDFFRVSHVVTLATGNRIAPGCSMNPILVILKVCHAPSDLGGAEVALEHFSTMLGSAVPH